MSIIVIERNASAQSYLAKALAAEGFQVRSVDHVDAIRTAQIVVLAAPRADHELLATIEVLRARHPDTIVLTATDRDDVADRLACYEAGADDCVFRPFHLGELAAKLRGFQRRRNGGASFALLATGDAIVDCAALELKVRDRSQSLTKREAELLAILARADGRTVDRERVLREAWGAPAWATNNSVDVYVGYVRRKLDLLSANVTVKTVRGSGFQIVQRKARAAPAEAAPDRRFALQK